MLPRIAFVYYTKGRKVLKVHLRVSWSGSTESGGYSSFVDLSADFLPLHEIRKSFNLLVSFHPGLKKAATTLYLEVQG